MDRTTGPQSEGHTVAVLGTTAVTLAAAVEACRRTTTSIFPTWARCRPPVEPRCKEDDVKSWSTMSDRSKTLTLMAACMQISLAVTAWTDLARRPAEDIDGPKALWAVVIGINFVGPIAYFTIGRRHDQH